MGNLTRQDVLDCLPPRAVADGFVAHSFRDTTNESSESMDAMTMTLALDLFQVCYTNFVILVIVHPPTFRKEVTRHPVPPRCSCYEEADRLTAPD